MSSFRASESSASGTSRDDVVSFGAALASDGKAVVVPDAHLLFNAEFKRIAGDLVLTDDRGHRFVVTGYFATDRHPDLVSPQGAVLTADIVDRLAGPLAPGATAQAGGAAGAATAAAIGRVEAASGDAAVVRNGVVIALNVGDVVLKGDVVQTGQASSVALTFLDGTAFNLSANARMVLNELVYNEGQAGNQALLSLVQGSISFLAGQIAKTGDMRVDTPVTTMGIRGTAVLVDILANDGTARFSVMVEQNGTVGSYVLLNKQTGALLATVNQSDTVFLVTPSGSGSVSVQALAKTPQDFAQEGALVSFLTPLATIPQLPQPGDQTPGGPNLNPRAGKGGSGSGAAGDGNAGDSGDDFGGAGFGLRGTYEPKDASGLNLITAYFAVTEPAKEFVFTPAPLIPVTVIAINDVQTILPQITTVTIPNQVFIQGSGTFVPFLADSASIVSVAGPAIVPAGLNLAGLLTLNPAQGTITYDNSAFSFLAQGQSVVYTIQFTAQVNGQTVTEILPITITGINDAPAFAAPTEALAVTDGAPPSVEVVLATDGTASVLGATDDSAPGAASKVAGPGPIVTVTGGKVVALGEIAFKDPDLSDTHSLSVKPEAGAAGTLVATLVDSTGTGQGAVDWTYTIDKTVLQALGAGETKVDTFVFSVSDGHGGAAAQSVSVTLVGINDAPTVCVTDVSDVAVCEPLHKSFTLASQTAISDPDIHDVKTPYVEGSATIASIVGPDCPPVDLAHLICLEAGTGTVRYDPAAFSFLEPGQSVAYTIHYLSQSGPDTVCSNLTFTISGPSGTPEPASTLAATPVPIELAGSPEVAGTAANDTFHFTDATIAAVVSDFHPAAKGATDSDLIVVDHALFATVEAVLSAAVETADGSTLIGTPDHSLLLKGVHLADLKASDFLIG